MKSRHLFIFIAFALFNFCLYGCSDTGLETLEIVNGTWEATDTNEISVMSDSPAAAEAILESTAEAVMASMPETVPAPPETEETSAETSVSTETAATQIAAAQTAAAQTAAAQTAAAQTAAAQIAAAQTAAAQTAAAQTTAAQTAAAQTTEAQTTASDKQTGIVYWVKNGEVWHLSPDCSSLSRSKDILSGTVSVAMNSGKERVCKRCGG